MSSSSTADFSAAVTTDAMADLIREKIRCRGHSKFDNPEVISMLTDWIKEGYTKVFHYEFVFFDIIDYRSPRPFLLIYTLLERGGGGIRHYTMSMISDNSVLNWYKANKLSVFSTHTQDGKLDQGEPPTVELQLVKSTTTHPVKKLYGLEKTCWGFVRG